MTVRIYQPARSTLQSGKARRQSWLLTFEADAPQVADALTGWAGSADTRRQLRLTFPTAESAVAYAKARNLDYVVQAPAARALKLQSYADNFR